MLGLGWHRLLGLELECDFQLLWCDKKYFSVGSTKEANRKVAGFFNASLKLYGMLTSSELIIVMVPN